METNKKNFSANELEIILLALIVMEAKLPYGDANKISALNVMNKISDALQETLLKNKVEGTSQV